MKRITLIIAIVLVIPVLLQAQFSGGNGRGDFMLQSLNNPITGTENNSSTVPASYSLEQNYPNPFNPTTSIKFNIAKLSLVKIVVYDVLGRKVQTLVNESLEPGSYEKSFDGSSLNSGIFFYKITAGDYSDVRKMLLIK
jgi:hypothetical protein